MPCWYFDKKDLKVTPSIKDGITFETERRYRKEGARFIMECGTAMSLGHNTMATGVVYFHRFYMFHSFKTFPRYLTACCCLLLAGKVEETPKKCRDIIKTARNLLNDEKFYSFGDDPKEEVLILERILLQTIKFDLQVEHPYSFLVKYAKCLKGDQAKLQKMVQMAWNFVNDSLSTTLCLQWEPEIIAVALIHLATKLSRFTVVDWTGRQSQHQRWWDMFVSDVTMEILEDICHQVLDLYQQSNRDNSRDTPSPLQKPPSKASPPPVRRPITPPLSSKTSPQPLAMSSTLSSSKTISQEEISSENNHTTTSSLTKVFPVEPVPPPRMYTPNYGGPMYPTHPPATYTGITPAPIPPPPQPPMYGHSQYPQQMQYSQSVPAPGHYPPIPAVHQGGIPPHHPGIPPSTIHHSTSHHGHHSSNYYPPPAAPGSAHNRSYYSS